MVRSETSASQGARGEWGAVGVAAVSRVSRRTKKIGRPTTDRSIVIKILTSSASASKNLQTGRRGLREKKNFSTTTGYCVRCAFLGQGAGLRSKCGFDLNAF